MKSMLKYDVIKPAVRSTKLPIIMLHGFYDDRGGLSEIAKSPLISADRTCYLLDLRNHGQSPWAKDMHFESMTGDVLSVMRHVGVHNAIWMGHSYGARIGYYAALQCAQSVSAVIAVDDAPISHKSMLPQFARMLDVFQRMESKEFEHRQDIEQFVGDQLPTLTESEIKFFTKSFVSMGTDTRKWRWKHNVDAMVDQKQNILDFPVPHDAQYHGPVYLLRGQHSEWAVDEQIDKETLRRFPNIKIRTVKGSGHNMPHDQPEATARCVYEALN